MNTLSPSRGSTRLTVREAAARLQLSEYRTRMLIASGALRSERIGHRRFVSQGAIEEVQAARAKRDAEILALAPSDWEWEGNVVSTLAAALKRDGWIEESRAVTALRRHGIDLVMRRDSRRLLVEVKGWPRTRRAPSIERALPLRAPHAMGRNYIGDLVLSAMLLRSRNPNDEVAVAIPRHKTCLALLEEIGPLLRRLGVGAYVIDESGGVEAFLRLEDVDLGREVRDRETERSRIRQLLALSDEEREATFVASNHNALELITTAKRVS